MASAQVSVRRFKIYFEDDAVCKRSQAVVHQLLTTAMDDTACGKSALLAKKALKYRRVYERMAGVDVNSPEFDASKFMGVLWCKTTCLKQFCARKLEDAKP